MWESEAHFSLGTFLKDKAIFIVLSVLLIIFIASTLVVLRVSTGGIIFVSVIISSAVLFYLAYEYLRQSSFWKKMVEASRSLEKSTHFIDLVDEPSFLQGKIARDVILAVLEADNEEIANLKASVRENSEYIELWVHEAKTPLAAAKLIAKRMRGTDALALCRELERMDDLIGQALFVARTESLTQDYLIREVNLANVAKEAGKSHMHYLTSLGVALEFRLDPAITVFADKMWLEFIIAQIILNAAKYDATTITFNAFKSEQESSSSCTVLEIKDDGCGIPAEDVPRVFDRGFTGEVGRAHGSATGMGLYLVARMCFGMGLSVLLASEEGVGTRVQISFPHDRRRARLEERNLTNT